MIGGGRPFGIGCVLRKDLMMQHPRHLFAVLALIAASIPAAAQAPSGFDGTYVGVSTIFLGTLGTGGGRACGRSDRPAVLTIANGIGSTRWYAGALVGPVTARGAIAMHNDFGIKLDGQIDSRGTLTASVVGFCNYNAVWQRQ
jgi:hypothetical protein